MSNGDAEAISEKLEQGINKNSQHIFRNPQGHFSEDNSHNRQLFLDTLMTPKNYLALDKYGKKW